MRVVWPNSMIERQNCLLSLSLDATLNLGFVLVQQGVFEILEANISSGKNDNESVHSFGSVFAQSQAQVAGAIEGGVSLSPPVPPDRERLLALDQGVHSVSSWEGDTSRSGAIKQSVRRTSSGWRPPAPQSGERTLLDRGGEGMWRALWG